METGVRSERLFLGALESVSFVIGSAQRINKAFLEFPITGRRSEAGPRLCFFLLIDVHHNHRATAVVSADCYIYYISAHGV